MLPHGEIDRLSHKSSEILPQQIVMSNQVRNSFMEGERPAQALGDPL